MFKLTMIFWLMTGNSLTMTVDDIKTEKACLERSATIITDLLKRDFVFIKATTRCEEYQTT